MLSLGLGLWRLMASQWIMMVTHLHQRRYQDEKDLLLDHHHGKEKMSYSLGNSLLKGNKDSICWTDRFLREDFCLPEACIMHNTRKLPSLI